MKIDIVVTQHRTLVALLIERGIITAETPVIEHATVEQVQFKHVLGILPHHLSSQAASITEIPIRFADAAERRSFAGGDIPLERLRKMAGDPVTYVVTQVHNHETHWLGMAQAMRFVEHNGERLGMGAGVMRWSSRTFRGWHVTLIGDGGQDTSAQVIEALGLWRPMCRGPWRDGFRQAVDDRDIKPAPGWDPASGEWGYGEFDRTPPEWRK